MPTADVRQLVAPVGTPDTWAGYTLEQARRDAIAAGEGLSTGFDALDAYGLRWQPGKLYAVAGRPSDGKTAMLLEFLMRHVERRAADADRAIEAGGSVDRPKAPATFVSYEENLHDVYLRLLKRQVAIYCDAHQQQRPRHGAMRYWLKTGSLPKDVAVSPFAGPWRNALQIAAHTIDEHARGGRLVLVDGDAEGGDIDALLETLRDGADARGAVPSLLVVDYYQKVRPPKAYRDASRQLQLQKVADELRQYAKGEGDAARAVPVLVAAQLTRGVVTEEGPPGLHHIREADDLANDTAGVLILYGKDSDDPTARQVTGRLVKNRDGRRDVDVALVLEGEYSRVREPAAEPELTAYERLERATKL